MTEGRQFVIVAGLGLLAASVLAGGLLGSVGWLPAIGGFGIAAVAALAVLLDLL